MATMRDDDWKALRAVPAWTPLRDLGWQTTHVGSELYYLGDSTYVLAQPITRSLETGHPDAPFVTMLFWATSHGAARRAALNQVDADDGATGAPPAVLCPTTDLPTYRALLEAARSHGKRRIIERATYAADGRFVHKLIDFLESQFYFRKVEIDPGEMPYVIAFPFPDV